MWEGKPPGDGVCGKKEEVRGMYEKWRRADGAFGGV